MDSSLKSIQAQSYTCLQDGIYKICRAALQLWGALKQKTQPPVWAASFQAGMQKACIPAEKLKSREQQQQNHQGSFPWNLLLCHSVFLWCGWTSACSCLAGYSAAGMLVHSGGGCTSRVEGEGTSCLSALLQQRGGTTGGQEQQDLGPRRFDSSESKTRHFSSETAFAQFLWL